MYTLLLTIALSQAGTVTPATIQGIGGFKTADTCRSAAIQWHQDIERQKSEWKADGKRIEVAIQSAICMNDTPPAVATDKT